MAENKQTIAVRWDGRGQRSCGKADGLTQDYCWDGPGAEVDVALDDIVKVLTEPGPLVCASKADQDALNRAASDATKAFKAITGDDIQEVFRQMGEAIADGVAEGFQDVDADVFEAAIAAQIAEEAKQAEGAKPEPPAEPEAEPDAASGRIKLDMPEPEQDIAAPASGPEPPKPKRRSRRKAKADKGETEE
jgi:Xaa-Pro aminopeptidase